MSGEVFLWHPASIRIIMWQGKKLWESKAEKQKGCYRVSCAEHKQAPAFRPSQKHVFR